jgi:hypothetical protein
MAHKLGVVFETSFQLVSFYHCRRHKRRKFAVCYFQQERRRGIVRNRSARIRLHGSVGNSRMLFCFKRHNQPSVFKNNEFQILFYRRNRGFNFYKLRLVAYKRRFYFARERNGFKSF